MDYEFPVQEDGMDFLFDPAKYFSELAKCQNRYAGSIRIRPSIELGLKPHLAKDYQKLLAKYPFDFAIGSTHLIKDMDPYDPAFWEGHSEKESLISYFEAVIENIRAFPEFDSCGHLDYAIRYAPSRFQSGNKEAGSNKSGSKGKVYQYSDYADYLDEALKLLIHHGIALEVNTAGYAKGLGQPNPQADVLKRYRELGGELITIGSDAHKPEWYACEFARVETLLTGLGFRYYAIYKQRKAMMERL